MFFALVECRYPVYANSLDEKDVCIEEIKQENVGMLNLGADVLIEEAGTDIGEDILFVVESFSSIMKIGDKQKINVSSNEGMTGDITFESSNEMVAEVDSNGWIKALSSGGTTITVVYEQEQKDLELTVLEDEKKQTLTDFDLGACPKEIEVGTSLVLSVAPIPQNVSNYSITFNSDNPQVLSVNELGRITANSVGTANISVTDGKITRTCKIAVVEEIGLIEAVDIEVRDCEDTLAVGDSLLLSAMVLPKNATHTEITYGSTNGEVAKVNSYGEVKGISPGKVTIVLSSGKVKKEIELTIKEETRGIQVNSNYLLLNPNETFQLKADVVPKNAPGKIIYKSTDINVASVSAGGLVTAIGCGNASVIISNDDVTVSVSVIVNESAGSNQEIERIEKESFLGNEYPNKVKAKDYPIIDSDFLKYLYEKERVLTVEGDIYNIYINGRDIVNFSNQINTNIDLRKEKDQISFEVNSSNNLCGPITINLRDIITEEKYVYLYNETTEKYEQIRVDDVSHIEISSAGKYLLTSKELKKERLDLSKVSLAGVGTLLFSLIYILTKKRYWFW